jgi:hypothetical protein
VTAGPMSPRGNTDSVNVAFSRSSAWYVARRTFRSNEIDVTALNPPPLIGVDVLHTFQRKLVHGGHGRVETSAVNWR